MAARKLSKSVDEDTTGADFDQDDTDDDEETTTGPLAAKANRKRTSVVDARRDRERAPIIRLARETHDPAEDWEVEHSGVDDPNGGPPRYDESPVKGGMIIAHDHLHARKGEIVNANGHEINPDDTDHKGFAKVINPDRYKDEEETL